MYGGIRTYVELHRTEKSLSSHNDEARRRPAKWMFGRSFHIQNLSTIILSIRDHMMEIMRRHHVLKLPSKALTCPCLSRRWLSHFGPVCFFLLHDDPKAKARNYLEARTRGFRSLGRDWHSSKSSQSRGHRVRVHTVGYSRKIQIHGPLFAVWAHYFS